MTTHDIVTELSERMTSALEKRDAKINFLRQTLSDAISALEACAPDGMSTEQITEMVRVIRNARSYDVHAVQGYAETVAQQVVRELRRVDASEGARVCPTIPCEHVWYESRYINAEDVGASDTICTKCGAQKVVWDHLTDIADKARKLAFRELQRVDASEGTRVLPACEHAWIAYHDRLGGYCRKCGADKNGAIQYSRYPRMAGENAFARAMTDEEIAEIYMPKGPATFCTCDAVHVCDNCKRLEAKMVLPIPASQSGACVAPVVGPCTMHGHEFTPLNEFHETPLCEVCGGTYPTEIAK